MKITDIQQMSLNQLRAKSQDELEIITRTIGAYVNRAVNKLKESGLSGIDSVQRLERTGGAIRSVYGPNQTKSKEDLISEIKRAQAYVQSPNATLTRIREHVRSVEKRLKVKFESIQQYNDFWELYNKVKEILPIDYDSTQTQDEIKRLMNENKSISEIMVYFTNIYEQSQESREDDDPFNLPGQTSGPLSGDYNDM